jgi:hypothetical protein
MAIIFTEAVGKFMECKQCQATLDQSAAIPVGSWNFCELCFRKLLEAQRTKSTEDTAPITTAQEEPGKEEGSGAPCEMTTEVVEGAEPAPTSENGQSVCMLCETPYESAMGLSGRLLQLCSSCINNLLAPFENASEPKAPVKEEPMIRRTFVQCGMCQRRVPGGGAKELENAPYCPECFLKKKTELDSVEVSLQASPKTVLVVKERRQANGEESCSACLQSFPTKRIQGFLLCQACHETDIESALELARERHRQLLRRMKAEIDQEG